MKSFVLIFSLLWIGSTFAQVPNHFLITSNLSVQITDPTCKEMAEKSKQEMQAEIKRLNQSIKKDKFSIKDRSLEQQSYFEVLQKLGTNPENSFMGLALSDHVIRSFRETEITPIYLSIQKVTLKSLGEANLEIAINDVQVSSSESAMDIVVKNPANPNAPIQKMHFSCSTGRLLTINEIPRKLSWLNYWVEFYREVKVMEWLDKAIMQVNPKLISQNERGRQLDETLVQLGLTTKEYLSTTTEKAKEIVKEIPYQIPINQMIAVLISKDEQKISFLTSESIKSYDFSGEELGAIYETWNLEKTDGNWHIYFLEADFDDSLVAIRSFYQSALDSAKQFKEENWSENIHFESTSKHFTHIEIIRDPSSIESEALIRTEIKPKLNQLLSEKKTLYVDFYQRLSSKSIDYWSESTDEKIILKDVLISNPEKTAFIFPVIQKQKENDETEYYESNEDFKFYVLLKNPNGTYKLYDWFYFKPLSYWSSYSLLRCAETHLGKISNYTADQEIINDQAFWDNYIFKRSTRGFDYLTELVLSNEPISISQSEFDATVQDCIDLLLEHDIVDLYDHQLKQIIRCINTIQTGSLNGTQNLKLVSLSQELYFQKRLNKIKKAEGNYYPELNIEFGAPLNKSSYYQFN
jgi:hypothetical protein